MSFLDPLLAAVVIALLAIHEPETVSECLHRGNPHLNDLRPLGVLAEGDAATVSAELLVS
jgi:hypothetical protein